MAARHIPTKGKNRNERVVATLIEAVFDFANTRDGAGWTVCHEAARWNENEKVLEALVRAGSCAADVVRVHYLLPDAADFEPCWPVLREYFAAALPAATMMVVGLANAAMKIEIEVTALKPEQQSAQGAT